MTTLLLRTLGALACLSAAGHASSGAFVAGQKIDSGLGDLPHYSLWADPSGRSPVRVAVPGESLDDGLGELPHYSQWKDPTGKDPLGRATLQADATPRR